MAVLLVVLYHAGVPHLTGGYVGVDVFFVISGFVITGVLLRERAGTGTTSLLDFYARRCRRILPAATLVLLGAVVAAYAALGAAAGNSAADDGRWVAVFLSNFHFAAVGTNYLAAHSPPSPLQNYWSLSVEEQFYVVFPSLFLLVAKLGSRTSLRARLAVALALVIAGSYAWSIAQTASHPASAYFSPFTRAWELALGALIAVGTGWLQRIPSPAAAGLTWAGLAAVLASGFVLSGQTSYPGSLVALPVLGAGAIIAGGVAVPARGAETLLGRSVPRRLGRISYSLYLWHWPILIIVAEWAGRSSLPVGDNLLLLVVAGALSTLTYRLVEQPFRHRHLPSARTVRIGVGAIGATVAVLSLMIVFGSQPVVAVRVRAADNAGVVVRQVAAAPAITTVPESVRKARFGAAYLEGGYFENLDCQASFAQTTEQVCPLGDATSHHLMVLYGDSHALMWIPAFEYIADIEHWQLVVLGKYGCPATVVSIASDPSLGEPVGSDRPCAQWHTWATAWIDRHRPSLLVISQADNYDAPAAPGGTAKPLTAAQWRQGLDRLFTSFHVPGMRVALLGTSPLLARRGPKCLAAHPDDVQFCSSPASVAVSPLYPVDRSVAADQHVQFVDTSPWFCTTVCTAVIGSYEVYDTTGAHVSGAWVSYLRRVLLHALVASAPAPA